MDLEGELIVEKNGDDEPSPELTITVNHANEKRLYTFVKTVSSLQELDDFRFENECALLKKQMLENVKKFTLRCTRKKCPFSLLTLRATTPAKSSADGNDNCKETMPQILHVYTHSKHNHPLKSKDERVMKRFRMQIAPDAIPRAPILFADGRKWVFVETVEHLVHQLDKLRLKYNCNNRRLEQMRSQKKISRRILCCGGREKAGCPFALLVQNTDLGRSHLYSSGKHTSCRYIKTREANAKHISMSLTPSEVEEINKKKHRQNEEKQSVNAIDEPPPLAVTKNIRNVKRRYTFLKTVHSLQEMDAVRIEHQCTQGTYLRKNSSTFQNVHLHCSNLQRGGNCPFALLVWRPNKNTDTIHLYVHNKHNHAVKPAEKRAMNRLPKHMLCSDYEQPPTNFVTPNGREWIFVETVGDAKEVEECRRKFNCYIPSVGERIEKQSRTTMFCSGKCVFTLLSQKTDRGRYHIYRSGSHTCRHKEENLLSQFAVLPDGHPPASITTRGAQQWTFVKTVKAEKQTRTSLAIMARKIGRKYHCLYADIKELLKTRRFICRIQLNCTANSSSGCRFRMLAIKTDQDRFHLYQSNKKHICLHRNGGINRRRIKKKEEERMWEDEEKENEMEEEDYEDEDEKEEEEREEEDEENEEEGGEALANANDKKECVQMKENADHDKIIPVTNALRVRSSTVPHEINDVQFIDFIDHAKNEGVKMHRLGEPKKETGASAITITMEEEDPANFSHNIKATKQEIKKEATADESGPSNRGDRYQKQQRDTNGTMAQPMAMINRHDQQQPVIARERWWIMPTTNQVVTSPNNGQRLLRERKRPINYRE